MASLAGMINDLETVTREYKDLITKYQGKEIPEDQQHRLEDLHQKGVDLKAEIEEEKAAQRTREMANLDAYLNQPQRTVPHAINADDDGRKVLDRMGWEVQNGVVYAPTSVANPLMGGEHKIPMFGEDVLFGDMPSGDPAASEFFKQTRAALQPGYREAYAKFLRKATQFRSEAMAFSMLAGREQAALSEGQDASGGFLVPPDVQAEILVRVAQRSVMRRLARVITTSRDRVIFPRVLPHPTAGVASIYSSAFVGGWVGETPAFTETDPQFGTFEIGIKKARVATKLSNDLMADSATNLLAFLAENGAENLALVEDNGFIAGDGGALQPLGLLNGGLPTVDVEGSTANTISNTTSATGSAPKILDLVYALPSQYAERASMLMRRAIEADVHKLVDANGRFMWPALSGSGFAAAPRDILGSPVYNSEWMPDDGTDANKVIVFGDFSGYIIAQRAQITSVILRERFADTDQTGVILFERVGGAPWNTDAFRVGIV